MSRIVCCCALLACLGWEALARTRELPTPTVEDAIAMTRIEMRASSDGRVAVLSPDGSTFAAVVWRGDLARNVNVYSLVVAKTAGGAHASTRQLVAFDFAGDSEDANAMAISHVSFTSDGRYVALIGRRQGQPAQVYRVSLESGALTQLTHSPDPVRSYVLSPDGQVRVFSVTIDDPSEADRIARLDEDGIFLAATGALARSWRFLTAAQSILASRPRQVRKHFWVPSGTGAAPVVIFDSRQSRPEPVKSADSKLPEYTLPSLDDEQALRSRASLTADASGRYALMFPYALGTHAMRAERYAYYKTAPFSLRFAAPYGLIHLDSGRIERLIDAPHVTLAPGVGFPVWATSGRFVIVHSLLPIESGKDAAGMTAAEAPPQWIEVDLATRRVTPLRLGPGWRAVGWKVPNTTLVISDGSRVGTITRNGEGTWGSVEDIRPVPILSPFRAAFSQDATDGRVVVGIEQGFVSPPELAVVDLSSGRTIARTDLNPDLRRRRYGDVEEIRWIGDRGLESSGFLVRPVTFEKGRRYPLVFLFDDSVLDPRGTPYLLDGTMQLSGHAIQMLAANGFAVLYTRTPAQRKVGTSEEGVPMREHVESALTYLDRLGLIDTERVGISGWSRSAYYTEYVLMHSPMKFAAATTIDGGSIDFSDGGRPYRDEELHRIRTPLLIQTHGPLSLTVRAQMFDRLDAVGKPVEHLYFSAAPHDTIRPLHRYRSLTVHIDWWRFWLQNYEDPSPDKQAQHERWRYLRTLAARTH